MNYLERGKHNKIKNENKNKLKNINKNKEIYLILSTSIVSEHFGGAIKPSFFFLLTIAFLWGYSCESEYHT